MICPNCKGIFKNKSLATHLSGKICTNCKGITFTLSDYLIYLTRSESLDEVLVSDVDVSVSDVGTKNALICSCGQIMSKYRISHDSERRVDYCSVCQAVWLDNGEWDYLKTNNLHRRINKIFTEPYQRNVRLEGTKVALNQNYERLLGASDYKKN